MLLSEIHGWPVRVFRGSSHKSKWSPKSGYTYAGLYNVDTHFEGKSDGFKICRFRLTQIEEKLTEIKTPKSPLIKKGKGSSRGTKKSKIVSYRIVRDTEMSNSVKEHYNHTCQICNTRIVINGIPYSEGAHIKPLGKPHYGSDTSDNVLCLCPNHHVIFDKGGIYVNDDLSLSIGGNLYVSKDHELDMENFKYHRKTICLKK